MSKDPQANPPKIGVAWRNGLAATVGCCSKVECLEVMFEEVDPSNLHPGLERAIADGIPIIVHGTTLSLGSAELPDQKILAQFLRVANRLGSPLASEHLAYTRAGGMDALQLLPVPRSKAMLEIFIQNVLHAKAAIRRPFAIENIAYLFQWPGGDFDEAEFLSEALRRTDSNLLLDLENLRITSHNFSMSPSSILCKLPLGRLGYVHVGGGELRAGRYHDTHSEPVSDETLDLLETLCTMTQVPMVILERDSNLPGVEELESELDRIRKATFRGCKKRNFSDVI